MKSRCALICVALVALTGTVPAQDRSRDAIGEQYKWNLTDLFPDKGAWRAEKDRLAGALSQSAPFAGTLGQSADRLAAALALQSEQQKVFYRLFTYANLGADEDTRVSENQALVDEMRQLGARFGAAWAFFEPELLKLDPATVTKWTQATPALKPFVVYLQDVLRRREHTLTASEEALLAQAGPVMAGPSTVANIFLNADLPWPTIKLSNSESIRLDVQGYSVARAAANRDDRRRAMESFFGALGAFRRTIGTALNTAVGVHLFETRARKYRSNLANALHGPNIPESVYHELVAGVNRHLGAFHRYLKLRQRILNVPELHYYDLYAPLVSGVPLKYTVEEAQREVKAATARLGEDYVQALDRAFKERWIDYYPSTGKRSGAYMSGWAYDVHPYLLLNYHGQYDDLSTLAHELGHAMHSWFSNKTQPFPTAGYPIFVAEVASTFNEALLNEEMLRKIKDPKARVAILGNYLEGVKGTLFRQTQFAEFELRMHQMAEKGQPLTGDALSKLYLEVTRKYYGHDQKVAVVDDYVAHEWAYVNHFFRPFYVFQYSTSFTASTALAEKVLSGDPDALKRYRAFLAAGGSKPPIDLLRDAGIDMTSSEPLDLTIQKMNRVMDELEKLIATMPTTAGR
ncbi:MAG TPA: oligoendopeptidase F [Vicinamibacterales bacterium]|nr:oligoendopeptidase F [Vicinamibacterales bacterium]